MASSAHEGVPAGGAPWPGVPAAAPHRPWSTLLLALDWLGVVVAVLPVPLAVAAVVQHLHVVRTLEEGVLYEPLHLFFVAVAVVVGLVALGALVPLLVVTTAARRRADAGDPRPLHRASVASAAVAGAAVVLTALGGDLAGVLLVAVVCAPYLLAAVVTAARTRTPAPAVLPPAR